MATAVSEKVEQWFGCYGGNQRKGLFLPASTRHPAKMPPVLCFKILNYGIEQGYWRPPDMILDPMCGTGTTLICGAVLGFRMFGLELEEHFYRLTCENIQFGAGRLWDVDKAAACVRKGDARRLTQIFQSAGAAVCSPPYGNSDLTQGGQFQSHREPNRPPASEASDHARYDAAVISPPYGDSRQSANVPHRARALAREGKWDEAIACMHEFDERELARGNRRAPRSDENIRKRLEESLEVDRGNYSPRADAIVGSPPYLAAQSGGGIAKKGHYDDAKLADRQYMPEIHGKTDGHIGNLKDPAGDINAVLSSPTSGQTYLGAMLDVYRGMYAVLRSNGVVALVTKNPVKNGAIRRLDTDTIRLMEHAGFALLERKQAMLAEHLEHPDMFGGPGVRLVREFKSFFKRRHETKRTDLRVDFEDVLFFRRLT